MLAPSCGLFRVCSNGQGKSRWVLSNNSGFSPVWQETILGRARSSPRNHHGTRGGWVARTSNSFLSWTQAPSARLCGNSRLSHEPAPGFLVLIPHPHPTPDLGSSGAHEIMDEQCVVGGPKTGTMEPGCCPRFCSTRDSFLSFLGSQLLLEVP